MLDRLKGAIPVRGGTHWYMISIVLLAVSFFLVGLHRIPVPTVDGAVRATEARNMLINHQLWPIEYQGQTITDHPPLYIWITALSFKIFGLSDFAANLPQRLFAALTVIMTALVAFEFGLSWATSLLSALILCLTRDFLLSSVRGYIEPLLEFFIYSAVYFSLRTKKISSSLAAMLSGVCIFFAFFSKGPVALWPFLFCGFLIFLRTPQKARAILSYLLGFLLCVCSWAIWVESNHHWDFWKSYLFGQVLGSALNGRGGAQQFEPFYFIKILMKYYWPWLPFLLWSSYEAIQKRKQTWIFGLLGLGFVGGFSLMKWKFWYYIAPGYPAFSILIASQITETFKNITEKSLIPKTVALACMTWILIATIFPIPLHHERVPEVFTFRDFILKSPKDMRIFFVRSPVDHNMIGTSGEWYFERTVEKIADETAWVSKDLVKPSWIILGTEEWKNCSEHWCQKSKLIAQHGRSSLVWFEP